MDTRSVPQFFGPSGGRLFGCYHPPAGAPHGAVLICPPVLAEAPRNYRREVLLARGLADAGIASLRFHYRGCGNSDGRSGDLTVPSMVADAVVAAAHLRHLAATPRLAFVGTRVGAVAACTAAGPVDGGPVVLWEPSANPAAYLREVLRARLISELKRGGAGGIGELLADLDAGRTVDVCGYPITGAFAASARERPLAGALGPGARPVLLLEPSPRGRVRREVDELAATWERIGCAVTVRPIAASEPWWFGASGRGGEIETGVAAEELVTQSLEFLTDRLAREPAR